MAKVIMTDSRFLEIIMQLVNSQTLYCKGGIGQPLYKANQDKLINQYAYNKNRASQIRSKDKNTFAVDCVGMVKTVLWGWNGNTGATYGGAKYTSNGVPDVTEGGMLNLCYDVSTDFSKIKPGEFVWLQGHCGVYIGDNLVAESTPKWKNGAQLSGINGRTYEGRSRNWTKHGKLPWIAYSGQVAPAQKPKKTNEEIAQEVKAGKWGNYPERKARLEAAGYNYREIQDIVEKLMKKPSQKPSQAPAYIVEYTVKRGDTLTAIANRNKTTVEAIMKLNPQIKDKNKIKAGQVIRIK